jgi:hypothetical protein
LRTLVVKHVLGYETNMKINPIVVQTLVLSQRGSAVLLGKWRGGTLTGRYTGLLGAAHRAEPPRRAAVRVAAALVPQLPPLQPERLEPRAIFDFHELPPKGIPSNPYNGEVGSEVCSTTELQYVYRLHDDEAAVGVYGGSGGGGDSVGGGIPYSLEGSQLEPQWFPLADIPYDFMPADDREWYPQVLDPEGPCLTGSFSFRGTTLLDHTMEELSPSSLAWAQAIGPDDNTL